VLGNDRRASEILVGVEQVGHAAVRHFHGHNHAACIAPEVFRADQVRVAQLHDRLQRANFPCGGGIGIAGQEFERGNLASRPPCLPNLSEGAAAEPLFQPIAGKRFEPWSQKRGRRHQACPSRSIGTGYVLQCSKRNAHGHAQRAIYRTLVRAPVEVKCPDLKRRAANSKY